MKKSTQNLLTSATVCIFFHHDPSVIISHLNYYRIFGWITQRARLVFFFLTEGADHNSSLLKTLFLHIAYQTYEMWALFSSQLSLSLSLARFALEHWPQPLLSHPFCLEHFVSVARP